MQEQYQTSSNLNLNQQNILNLTAWLLVVNGEDSKEEKDDDDDGDDEGERTK